MFKKGPCRESTEKHQLQNTTSTDKF